MTLKECYWIAHVMWQRLAEHPEEGKLEAIKALTLPKMSCSCPFCELVDNCKHCPGQELWGCDCCLKESPYKQWEMARKCNDLPEASRQAKIIADFCLKKFKELEQVTKNERQS